MKNRYSGVGSLILALLLAVLVGVQSGYGQSRTFTTDADFDEGVLANVNHDAPNNNQLQLNRGTAQFPYVNIAASARGTAIRAHTETGAFIGEFFTAPNGQPRNPSRTTVDQLGNTWVGNRDAGGFVDGVNRGSLTRIGVVVGGTRVDASGNPDPNGQFLEGPFDYNTCQDRHGATVGTAPDGLIKTSRGLANILPWTNAGGVDTNGGVATAEDECIINYVRAGSPNTRTIAIDKNNDVWVGGTGTRMHEKVNGVTGQRVPGTNFTFGCGGYGGLIDGNGILWSMTSGGSYLRFDTNTLTGACLPLTNYGVGVDPATGNIWITTLSNSVVYRVDPITGAATGTFPHGNPYAQGVAVDNNGNVWVAHSLFNGFTVGHLRTDGTFVGNVPLPGGAGATGVAVDANGKVWVANINSNNAMRIDPNAGPIGGGGFPVGAVDLVLDLGAGAGPYNYSDMTGAVVASVTAPQGTWTVIHDGGAAGVDWDKVSWTADTPLGTSVTVRVRAAENVADLGSAPYVTVANGASFAGISGRYLQIQATLAREGTSASSPVLFDLTVDPAQNGGDATPPACGPIVVEKNALGQLVAVNSSTSDPESGIASVKFTKLVNLAGYLNGAGPYAQGNTVAFDPAATPTVQIRGERIDMTKGGSIVVLVTNGAGLTANCDPVIENVSAEVPQHFAMEQNYPNPFNPSTKIRFELPEASHVELQVFDLTGRLVQTLVSEQVQAGTHEVEWDGRDSGGNALPSGTYLARIKAGSFLQTRLMTLLK